MSTHSICFTAELTKFILNYHQIIKMISFSEAMPCIFRSGNRKTELFHICTVIPQISMCAQSLGTAFIILQGTHKLYSAFIKTDDNENTVLMCRLV